MKQKDSIIKILLLVALCTYVNVPYYFAGVTFLHKALYYVFALLPVFRVIYKKVLKIEKRLFSFIMYFMVCFFAIFVVTVINASNFDYLEYFMRGLLNIFAMIEVYHIWKVSKLKISFEEIYVLSAINYIIGTLFFIAIPGAKDFWMNMIVGYGGEQFVEHSEYVTRFGYAGFSGFGVALYISIAMLYLVYLYLSKRIKWNRTKIYMMVLCLGTMFYGRVGTISTLVTVGCLVIYTCLKGNGSIIRTVIKVIAVISIVMTLIYRCVPASRVVIEWIFEPVCNFIQYGEFSSLSSNDLFGMYERFNPGPEVWLKGTGLWLNQNGTYYGGVDVGVMRTIYFGGLFYTIFLYGLALFIIHMLYKLLSKKIRKDALMVVLVSMIILILFEMKGDAELSWLKSMIVLYMSCFDYYKKECAEEKMNACNKIKLVS